MQLLLEIDDRTAKLAEIHRRLQEALGPLGPFLCLDPVSQLVMGLIGGKTRGEVSKAAFEKLQKHFGSWEAVRDAEVTEIHKVICRVTFADVKAIRLKQTLKIITQTNGCLSLERLEELTVEEALAWLERLPGVGRKVAAATLNFSTFRKAALVIDTHHLRVLRRLRFVGEQYTLTQAYDCIMPLLPADWSAGDLDDHHELVKLLGQTVCRYDAPDCGLCALEDLCPSAPQARSSDDHLLGRSI